MGEEEGRGYSDRRDLKIDMLQRVDAVHVLLSSEMQMRSTRDAH